MSMNYEKFGIVMSIVILCSVMAVASVSSGEIDLGVSSDIEQYNASTKTTNPYYEWCYKMKVDCS